MKGLIWASFTFQEGKHLKLLNSLKPYKQKQLAVYQTRLEEQVLAGRSWREGGRVRLGVGVDWDDVPSAVGEKLTAKN